MQTESNNTNGLINIDQIKKLELLDYNGIKGTLLCDKSEVETWEEHAKDFREEDFIKAVWSLVEHCRRNDEFCQQCCEFISGFVVNSEGKKYLSYTDIYNFFLCLWKLDIKPGELPENIKLILMNEDRHLKTCMFNHWDLSRPMDYDFVVWFLDSGGLSKNQICSFQSHHDYTFSSYGRFEKFVNDNGIKYEIKIHVQSLHVVLKQKPSDDKYFSKDEFIDLIQKKKIIFKKPSEVPTSDLPDSELFGEINSHFKTLNYDSEKQKKLPQAKKDYWEYVKKQLFGNPGGKVKGLLNITKFEENDIKEILSWILMIDSQSNFEFLNIESNDSTDEDIFHISKDCFANEVDTKLSRIDFCDLSKVKNENDKRKLEFFVKDLLEYKDIMLDPSKYKYKLDDNTQITPGMITLTPEQRKADTTKKMGSKFRKIATGIILIVVGIILCVIDLLTLGLASKLAVALFLLALLAVAIGIICLVWEKISDCVRKFDPRIPNPKIIDESNQDKGEGEKEEIGLTNNDNRGRDDSINL